MGLISSRISARPERASESPADRACQASLPTSQSNESFWMARRLGTSRCSVILPKEIRRGAKALDELMVFAGREAAKMRPSEDRWCGGRFACRPMDPGRERPQRDAGRQGDSRQTAQTSSVAERLTAVQSPPRSNRKTPLTSENTETRVSRH